MENQRSILIFAMLAICAVLYMKWLEFSAPKTSVEQTVATEQAIPQQAPEDNNAVPSAPKENATAEQATPVAETKSLKQSTQNLITVTTDLVVAKINPHGGVIESLELLKEPITLDKPGGFALLKKTASEHFVTEDGLLSTSGHKAPVHTETGYQSDKTEFDLQGADSLEVPLRWVSKDGVEYTKVFTFKRDSYLIDINYQINNRSAKPWKGFLYAQFNRSQPEKSGGGFGQLPSFTGGAIYTEDKKYQKIDFKEMRKEPLDLKTDNGWAAMLQHYFVGAWVPQNGVEKQFFSAGSESSGNYRIGYKTLQPVVVNSNQSGQLNTTVYLGSKEQKRLKNIQKQFSIKGLALTVDYGWLTFIADPLFVILSWIHKIVQNWGWAIIILTILIKLVFYPLSAASFKSMAGMKKLQPRIQTLKERYKDDRQKFQMEMMALYKKEKINPAGGCLPILIQIPVFIALYWVLLESVEMRHAPFALWLQDLSSPDPYYVLPVLMGLSMWAQQKLNPAPTDDIQKKVMMIMPIVLTFLFIGFPQGLVLYWVVNNILTMAQQWFIYKQLDKQGAK